jgi:restriction system protein
VARRTVRRTFIDLLLSGLGLLLIAVALLIMLVREFPLQVLAVTLVAVGAWQYLNHLRRRRREANWSIAKEHTRSLIQQHRNALISYYRQSIVRDYFGNEDTRAWKARLDTFVNRQVLPRLSEQSVRLDDSLPERIGAYVDATVRELAAQDIQHDAPEPDLGALSGPDYERYCASILRGRGWTVQETPVTRDFGADLIAERNGIRLAVQCKLYAKPVGNKAVQEINSARPLYNATHACVVAPFGFTKQAERTAHGHGVRLLGHSGLALFADELCSVASPQ